MDVVLSGEGKHFILGWCVSWWNCYCKKYDTNEKQEGKEEQDTSCWFYHFYEEDALTTFQEKYLEEDERERRGSEAAEYVHWK